MTNTAALFLTNDDLALMALVGLGFILRNWWLLIRYGLGLEKRFVDRPHSWLVAHTRRP